ncbi:serine/threonine-protein kinase pim-3-like isoform X2 [Pseudorasbora parva]|uniref:serine/threonine-protein kinase pim-3-like isoform X2 n=1 Tax=Pseudorasbora parva TaxID=51549 RepID=UPI00351E7148
MSMPHMGEKGASGRSRSSRATFPQEVWRPGSGDLAQDAPQDPTHTQKIPGSLTPMSCEFSVSVSTGQADRKLEWQSGSRQSPDDGRPSSSFERSHRDASPSPSLSLPEDEIERRLNDLERKLDDLERQLLSPSSGDSWDSQSEQGSFSDDCLSRSDSLEGWLCPPLPGQVPVEPTETSNGRTAQGATEASPANKSSTETPTGSRKRNVIHSFLERLWKAMKSPFCCCCLSAVDVVEPFVPPPDLEPEPDPKPSSPAPVHSVVEPNNESLESLYNVGKMIGSGMFGCVYEGTRKFDGKRVAIKRMTKFDNFLYLDIPGHPEPLVTEVALLLMMRREPISPYVIQLYEWFEHPRKFTLVLENPEPCESLKDALTRHPGLCETVARVFMQQAVLAVQHCIEHGVFHNDINAQNILLKKNTFELKLIDFGCGQLFSSDGYESSAYLGLQDHCPPEVFTEPRFHAVPANVWALGVLLYEMVNARRPFRNRMETIQAKLRFQNGNLSLGCMDLIGQCLTGDPTKRPTLEQMLQHKWIRNDDSTVAWSSSGDSLDQ